MLIENETDKLLMVPGPTPVHREILDAIAEPTIWHSSEAIAEVVLDCQRGLQRIAGAQDSTVFLFAGSGTLAQEAALVNLVAPGERVLVASNGYFGDRFAAIAQRYGIEAETLSARWGTSVTAEELDRKLSTGRYRAVTITHVDTSTGVAAPAAELSGIARSHGALVILDAVCSLGGMPVLMDAWGVDIVLSGAQKALGVPPGLTILLVSSAALERRRSLASVAAFYADLLNWEASMHDPKVYFSTHAINLFYGLAAALKMVEREGLPARYARHERLAAGLRAGAEALGFSVFAEPEVRAPTLSVLLYPDGIQDETFRSTLSRNGAVAAGCIGALKGKGLRFGHMGNISDMEILQTLSAMEEAAGGDAPGAALAASRRALSTAREAIHAG